MPLILAPPAPRYREGLWTPLDDSGASLVFTAVTGSWERIGNLVIARCTLTYPSTASGAGAQIKGLPFACSRIGEAAGVVSYSTATTATQGGFLWGSSTQIQIAAADGGSLITNATMSLKVLRFFAQYRTADP